MAAPQKALFAIKINKNTLAENIGGMELKSFKISLMLFHYI